MKLHELTATEIVAAIAAGATTCEAVTRGCLERIAEREPQVQAWQYIDPDYVLIGACLLLHLRQSGLEGCKRCAAGTQSAHSISAFIDDLLHQLERTRE